MDKTDALNRLRRLSPLLDECLELESGAVQPWIGELKNQNPTFLPLAQDLVSARHSRRFRGFLADCPTFPDELNLSTPLPGSKVGPYELLRQLGRGGMSTVWLARHPFHRRPVAIKLQRMAHSTDAAERVDHERQMTALMAHRRVARLLDAGIDNRFGAYLVLHFVDGTPLPNGPELQGLDPAQRLMLFVRMTELVAHVHERGVVHRDLKPSNFMVTGGGEVHLIDFGIAMPVGAPAGAAALAKQCQTPAYASPEHGRAMSTTAASDVYSLGVILCELMTRQRPDGVFDGGTTPAWPHVATQPGWRGLASTALSPRAEDRYASAVELAAAVHDLARGERRRKPQRRISPAASRRLRQRSP
ncbi:serine/threonine-protein kinase [Variovorax sp. J22R133]|uniref:serine/threonine-protein kinase n=1 Tax=Variovorax brevis TaxID=3053503 RepID=UPI00257676D5|nr:serine/threonine-protein kinase [Variovorax sp. J22R133]MDM0117908.1 serine/threonine-protein kinase [Variovorax sp. J22R133]